jgi:hypothetical protein
MNRVSEKFGRPETASAPAAATELIDHCLFGVRVLRSRKEEPRPVRGYDVRGVARCCGAHESGGGLDPRSPNR